MQFDGEKPDKIARGACACNDDKVIFENPLNWTTRSFIFAKQREYENGAPLRSPVAKLSCEAATEENATCQELSQLRESFGATEFASKEWSESHGNANQAQSKSESVKNGADDDEVFSNKGVEIDLNSGWRNC